MRIVINVSPSILLMHLHFLQGPSQSCTHADVLFKVWDVPLPFSLRGLGWLLECAKCGRDGIRDGSRRRRLVEKRRWKPCLPSLKVSGKEGRWANGHRECSLMCSRTHGCTRTSLTTSPSGAFRLFGRALSHPERSA